MSWSWVRENDSEVNATPCSNSSYCSIQEIQENIQELPKTELHGMTVWGCSEFDMMIPKEWWVDDAQTIHLSSQDTQEMRWLRSFSSRVVGFACGGAQRKRLTWYLPIYSTAERKTKVCISCKYTYIQSLGEKKRMKVTGRTGERKNKG